jgi:putative Mg2+ transporter-C (MgtC) family protein
MIEQFVDPTSVMFGKLALAAFLGILIGTERAVVGKPAGTRTFALISLGSCLFILIALQVTTAYLGLVNFDPTRMAAAIVSGAGFLGVGLVVMRNESIHGVTTAAGLWVSAAVGTAVGFGLYSTAIFSTVATLVIFTAMWFVENSMKNWFGHMHKENIPPHTN